MFSKCDSSEAVFLTGSDRKSMQHICQHLTSVSTMSTCICLLLLSLALCPFGVFSFFVVVVWFKTSLRNSYLKVKFKAKDVINSIRYHSPLFLFISPLIWAHHAAVSSETPESFWWSVCLWGLLQRSRWWVLSRSRLTSECFLWWTGLCVSCPYSSGNEWCSEPARMERVLSDMMTDLIWLDCNISQ